MRIAEASRFHILPLVREIPETWHKQQNQKLIYAPITVKSSLYLRWNLCLRLCSSSEDDADSLQTMNFELNLNFKANSLEAFFYFGANNEQNHLFVFALIFIVLSASHLVISSHFIISISQKSAFPNCNTYLRNLFMYKIDFFSLFVFLIRLLNFI